MQIIRKQIINYAQGRQSHSPEAIMIHLTNTSAEDTLIQSNNPDARSSYHYLVRGNGQVWQFVNDSDTAWHSPGVIQSNWKLLRNGVNTNLYTVGIGVEVKTGRSWSPKTLNSCAQLLKKLSSKWNIALGPDTIICSSTVNSLPKFEDPSQEVWLKELMNRLGVKESLPDLIDNEDMQQEKERMKQQISNLELRNAALEKELSGNTTGEHEHQELKELLKQNTSLAEEIYLLQQELVKFQNLNSRLNTSLDSEKFHTNLKIFSTKELLSAVVRKLTGNG